MNLGKWQKLKLLSCNNVISDFHIAHIYSGRINEFFSILLTEKMDPLVLFCSENEIQVTMRSGE